MTRRRRTEYRPERRPLTETSVEVFGEITSLESKVRIRLLGRNEALKQELLEEVKEVYHWADQAQRAIMSQQEFRERATERYAAIAIRLSKAMESF